MTPDSPADHTAHDLDVDVRDSVALVEMRRPPHNFLDHGVVVALADAFEEIERDARVRAIVLCAQGDSFCAGANLNDAGGVPKPTSSRTVNPIYQEALRLFAVGKPVVAAIQGGAIGGGLGLALVADFRVTCAEARLCANFARLGLSPGFGLTATLPRLVGAQKAAMLFYTGRRIGGEEAVALGLADILVPRADLRDRALALAAEIAVSSPTVVRGVRAQLRHDLLPLVREAVARESAAQHADFRSADFQEGVAAMAARRPPVFSGV